MCIRDRGNCDSEVDEMVLDFPLATVFSTVLLEGRRLFMTHGHIYDEDHRPPLNRGDVLLCGHTHTPALGKKDEVFMANPGSLSLPPEGYPRAYGAVSYTHLDVYKRQIADSAVINSIDVNKDIDCFHPFNMGKLALGEPTFPPATPSAVIEILERYAREVEKVEPKDFFEGAEIVVVGHSNIVGKPAAFLALNRNATTTVALSLIHI